MLRSRGRLLLNRAAPQAPWRPALEAARLYLLFTPQVCRRHEPLAALEAALPWVDVIQVRPKEPEHGLDPLRPASEPARTEARVLHEWTLRVLDLVAARPHPRPLVIVNDRVDVARALAPNGCCGVHLGQDDTPPAVAREVLGDQACIGLSTHSPAQVARALDEPVDYLGFGPIGRTKTKGYERGLGAEGAWVAQQSADMPVFPIGGIDELTAVALADIGRAALASAVLEAEDPGTAAQRIRAALSTGED